MTRCALILRIELLFTDCAAFNWGSTPSHVLYVFNCLLSSRILRFHSAVGAVRVFCTVAFSVEPPFPIVDFSLELRNFVGMLRLEFHECALSLAFLLFFLGNQFPKVMSI